MSLGPSEAARDKRRTRPPRALTVIRDPDPDEVDASIDWSPWYLTDEEDMGEGGEQEQIISLLKSVLTELARERHWQGVHIAGDQFFAWIPDQPLVRVSPDVYILDDPPPPPLPRMWKTWLPDHRPPRFAVEVVSGGDDRANGWRKDYKDAPAKYAQLGSRELAIFDPEAAGAGTGRVALQLYRREADGSFVRVHSGAGPVSSKELQAYLVVVAHGPVWRLRLARDPGGTDLVPSVEEARDAAERELEAARAEIERLRRGKD